MLNPKEISSVLLIILLFALTISFLRSIESFLYTLLAVFLVVFINILAKKITSFYLESEIEIKLWGIKRYGFKPDWHFKHPFPAGIFFPIIISALSFGNLIWMASLVFDVKAKVYRAAKRHGLYSYSEMTEWHIGLIAAVGVFVNIIFAVLGYLAGFPEFARLNLYFAFFNILPLSDLDGNKIFFGSPILWSFLAAVVLIGMGYAIFLV
jgi:hypothetical protein